jgi:hypothetical protein
MFSRDLERRCVGSWPSAAQPTGSGQSESRCGCACRLIDVREYVQAFGFNLGLKPVHRILGTVIAPYRYQSFRGHRVSL